jgi:hypothetical protein
LRTCQIFILRKLRKITVLLLSGQIFSKINQDLRFKLRVLCEIEASLFDKTATTKIKANLTMLSLTEA